MINPSPSKPEGRPPKAPEHGNIALYRMPQEVTGICQPGLFHVVRAEDGQEDSLTGYQPHRHDFFEIIWIRSGRGLIRSDLRTYELRHNTLFFSSPGQVHSWEFHGPVRRDLVSFTEEFFSVSSDNPGILAKMPFFYAGGADPLLILEPAEARRIDQLFGQLQTEAAEAGPGREDLVRAYLTILLTLARQYYLRRTPRTTGLTTAIDLISHRFRLALAENFPRLQTVVEYAQLLGVSRTNLNDHLQRELGRTASELIHDRIVLEAKRHLKHTTLTSAQIAYRLRFHDPSYFGRFFRRNTGLTPGEYRSRAHSDPPAA